MSYSTVYNLLLGTAEALDNNFYPVARYEVAEPLVIGKTYTLSAYVEEVSRSGSDYPALSVYDGAAWWSQGNLSGDVPGVQTITFTYKQPFEGHADPSRLILYNTPPEGTGVTRRARLRDVMLVEGDTPRAWAPAEGEEIAGAGAQTSANLWSDSTASMQVRADGTYLAGKVSGSLSSAVTGLDSLTENQTVHMGASLKGAGMGVLKPFVEYRDAAGNLNSTGFPSWQPTDSWQRFEGTCVVPSGMTVIGVGFSNDAATGDIQVANPVFSYGSPVTLASGAHTPYATQDHVAAEYSTKASQKILSDSITSEVNARARTDGAVSELSSKMEQTVNGINVSLDRMAATEQQIHSWFDFGSDASGNPKLAMGASSSPIIGEYSNTGTTYKDRSEATLLALDAANSTTGADHMVSKDISIGKWQWVPTNSGNNLTLVWKG